MRCLVDEDLPRSTDTLLRKYNHEAIDVRDIGLRGAKDTAIAQYAQENHLCLITGDTDFADIIKYPPEKYDGIIVLRLPGHATASFILQLIEQFLQQEPLIVKIPGKLGIIEPGQVRFR